MIVRRSALTELLTSKCRSSPSGEVDARVIGKGAVFTVVVVLASVGVSLHADFAAQTVVPTVIGAAVLLRIVIRGFANVAASEA